MGRLTDQQHPQHQIRRLTLPHVLDSKSSLFQTFYLLLALLSGLAGVPVLSATITNYTVAVFASMTCDHVDGGRTTEGWVDKTFRTSSSRYPMASFRLSPRLVDICPQSSWVSNVLEVTSEKSWADAMIGPGSSELCSHSVWLANNIDRPLISYKCFDDEFSQQQMSSTFRRTVPDNSMTGKALASILEHFRWKRVAIFYQPSSPWKNMAYDVHRILSLGRFAIRMLVSLPKNLTVERTRYTLAESVSTDTKGKFVNNL